MAYTMSFTFKIYTCDYTECLSHDSSFPDYEFWPRAPKRWIYDVMSNAKQLVEGEGLPIEITSNADGMVESRREVFEERNLARPMTKKKSKQEFRLRVLWDWSVAT